MIKERTLMYILLVAGIVFAAVLSIILCFHNKSKQELYYTSIQIDEPGNDFAETD